MAQPAYIILLVEPDRDTAGQLIVGERGAAAAAQERLGRPERSSPVIDAVLGALRGPFPQAQLTGDRVISIECGEGQLQGTVDAVAGGIAKFGLQMTVQPGHLALAFGDELTGYATRTLDAEVPFASPHGVAEILQRMQLVQQHLDAHAGPGQGMADFTIVLDQGAEETYVQSYFDGAEGGFVLEIRLGSADRHYRLGRVSLSDALGVFRAWMSGERELVDSKWEKLDL